jgi:hypothetical protein
VRIKKVIRAVKTVVLLAVLAAAVYYGYNAYQKYNEAKLLKAVIARLTADSRIAEVSVTEVRVEPKTNKTYTSIKFVEYDTEGKPVEAKFFTFTGNIIQFQSMVIRFDDYYVKNGDSLRGKSAYVFMKAFALHEDNTAEVFTINEVNEVPRGYAVSKVNNSFERELWRDFWAYALKEKEGDGVKNAQIEAPGTKFVPGLLYTIKIEHDGGIRIDAKKN